MSQCAKSEASLFDPLKPFDYCLEGSTFNHETCRCDCDVLYRECPCDKKWDHHRCACVCANPVSCMDPYQWSDQACDCVCKPPTKPCPCGLEWNPWKCICEGSSTISLCRAPLVWNAQTCACVCQEPTKICPCNFDWNTQKCGCDCMTRKICVYPKIFSSSACDCVCKALSTRPREELMEACLMQGTVWSDEMCTCIECAPIQCTEPQIWWQPRCACLCKPEVNFTVPELIQKCIDAGLTWSFAHCDCV